MSINAKNDTISKALSLDGNVGTLSEFYDEWSNNYDQDLSDEGYTAPSVISGILEGYRPDRAIKILDAGCGTGLAGMCLAKMGYKHLYGFDLSAEMVEIARSKKCYSQVTPNIDMNTSLNLLSNDYDVILSCGVYTLGHVPPQTLDNLLEIVSVGGLIIVSTRNSYVESSGFDRYVTELENQKKLTVEATFADKPYTSEERAGYWVLRRL